MTRYGSVLLVVVSMFATACAIEESALNSTESLVPGPAEATAAVPVAEPATEESPVPTAAEPTVSASTTSEQTTTLQNGLDVIIRAAPDSGSVAVVLIFDIGSNHDPAGRSGLAHFAEHLLVTSATDSEPGRTVEEFVAAYPLGWNAQTGSDFTVLATLVEPADLEAELVLVAGRLRGIQSTSQDVERERGRILREVNNMFTDIASLAVANRAREQLVPTPDGGRRGGQPDVLASVTLDELIDWLGFYGPSNAVLSIAGDLDVEATAEVVADHFADIPVGPAAPAPAAPADRGDGLVVVSGPSSEGLIAIAYAAPEPAHDLYPAFLVAASRLFVDGPTAGLTALFAPLDQPDMIVISTMLQPDEEGPAGFVRVRSMVEDLLTAPLAAREVEQTILIFAPLLGLSAPTNTYAAAFSQGRQLRLGLDVRQVVADLRLVHETAYLDAVDVLFTTAPASAAVIEAE